MPGPEERLVNEHLFETTGFLALIASVFVCASVSAMLFWFGRGAKTSMFRKEAMAVVGLSWVLATVLGALPFYIAGIYRCSSVRLLGPDEAPILFHFGVVRLRQQWEEVPPLSPPAYALMQALCSKGARRPVAPGSSGRRTEYPECGPHAARPDAV